MFARARCMKRVDRERFESWFQMNSQPLYRSVLDIGFVTHKTVVPSALVGWSCPLDCSESE
jgi:hypothetical protein